MKDLLPIGSVVLLKGGTKRVMIYGRMQRQVDNNKLWDYVACYYPEGNTDPDKSFLFDQEQIERVFFIGFQDDEEFQYKSYLAEKLADMNKVSE